MIFAPRAGSSGSCDGRTRTAARQTQAREHPPRSTTHSSTGSLRPPRRRCLLHRPSLRNGRRLLRRRHRRVRRSSHRADPLQDQTVRPDRKAARRCAAPQLRRTWRRLRAPSCASPRPAAGLKERPWRLALLRRPAARLRIARGGTGRMTLSPRRRRRPRDATREHLPAVRRRGMRTTATA